MCKLGIILTKDFDNWTCNLSKYFIHDLYTDLDTYLITNQERYDEICYEVDAVLHVSPGWSSPLIEHKHDVKTLMILSDSHENKWRQDYYTANNCNYLLSYYPNPTKFHFRKINHSQIVPFYWSIPDRYTYDLPLYYDDTKIQLFGAVNHEAYETRNWCKQYDFVQSHDNSGVENKKYTAKAYLNFLRSYDSFIAAGSLDEKYRMLLPKYFEIANAGSLLFAQDCEDLHEAGFIDGENCIIFDKTNFYDKARRYLEYPESHIRIRNNGIDLIKSKHLNKHRIETIKELINE